MLIGGPWLIIVPDGGGGLVGVLLNEGVAIYCLLGDYWGVIGLGGVCFGVPVSGGDPGWLNTALCCALGDTTYPSFLSS